MNICLDSHQQTGPETSVIPLGIHSVARDSLGLHWRRAKGMISEISCAANWVDLFVHRVERGRPPSVSGCRWPRHRCPSLMGCSSADQYIGTALGRRRADRRLVAGQFRDDHADVPAKPGGDEAGIVNGVVGVTMTESRPEVLTLGRPTTTASNATFQYLDRLGVSGCGAAAPISSGDTAWCNR